MGGNEVLDLELLDHAVNVGVSELDVADLDSRLLWDEIHLSLSFLGNLSDAHITYLFLKLKRDTSNGSLLNTLHKMRGVT